MKTELFYCRVITVSIVQFSFVLYTIYGLFKVLCIIKKVSLEFDDFLKLQQFPKKESLKKSLFFLFRPTYILFFTFKK